jgi:hypothetical protein
MSAAHRMQRSAGMKHLIAMLVAAAAACKKDAPADLPKACYVALDCCSALGPDADGRYKFQCDDARRLAEEGSAAKCEIAFDLLRVEIQRHESLPPSCKMD